MSVQWLPQTQLSVFRKKALTPEVTGKHLKEKRLTNCEREAYKAIAHHRFHQQDVYHEDWEDTPKPVRLLQFGALNHVTTMV